MESRTVRYNKGEMYSMGMLPILPDEMLCDEVDALFEYVNKECRYKALKTFEATFSIKLIEDEES